MLPLFLFALVLLGFLFAGVRARLPYMLRQKECRGGLCKRAVFRLALQNQLPRLCFSQSNSVAYLLCQQTSPNFPARSIGVQHKEGFGAAIVLNCGAQLQKFRIFRESHLPKLLRLRKPFCTCGTTTPAHSHNRQAFFLLCFLLKAIR